MLALFGSSSAQVCQQHGRCLGGDLVLQGSAAGYAECQNSCVFLGTDCQYFTYDINVDKCDMWSQCTSLDTTFKSQVSSQRSCEGDICDISGGPSRGTSSSQAVVGVQSALDCRELCQADLYCEWYTYDSLPPGICSFWSSINDIDSSLTTQVTGERTCGQLPTGNFCQNS